MQKLLSYLKLKGARNFIFVLGVAMAFTPASNETHIKAKKLALNDMPSEFFEASLDRNTVQFTQTSIEAKIAYPEGKMAAIPEAGASGTPIPTPSPTPKATPKPTPKPETEINIEVVSAPVVQVSNYTENTSNYDVVQYIIKYAQEYEVNADIMIKIAECESGYNPNAVNGPFGGIFQFIASTWSSNRNAMGLDPNPDLRFNAEEAARTAAFKMSRDGYGAWPACSQKAMREI